MDESIEPDPEISHVDPVGEIDMQSCQQFADELNSALSSGAKRIDLCLGKVTFIDSSGIRVIVECANKAKENGISIHVRDAAGEVLRVLEISGTLGTVIHDTPA